MDFDRFALLSRNVTAKLGDGQFAVPADLLTTLAAVLPECAAGFADEGHRTALHALAAALPCGELPGFASLSVSGAVHGAAAARTFKAYEMKSTLCVEASPRAFDDLFQAIAAAVARAPESDALWSCLAGLAASRVHTACLKRLFPRLVSVSRLDLASLSGPPSHELDYVLSAMSQEGLMRLKHVSIKSLHVPDTLHNLQVLNNLVSLDWTKAQHDNNWADIFASLPLLTRLSLEVVPPEQEPDAFKRAHLELLTDVLAAHPALERMDLSLRIRYRGCLGCLSKLSRVLEHLRVFWSATWTTLDAEAIAALPVSVHVEANSLESTASWAFASMKNLTSLVYTGYVYDWSGAWAYRPKLNVDVLTELPQLKSLYAAALFLRNAPSVGALTTLTCLELEENESADSQELYWSSLSALTALEKLKLSKSKHAADPCSWVPLTPLSGLTRLTALALVEIPAADADFSFLAALPRLVDVTLRNTNFDTWAAQEAVPLAVLAPALRSLTALQLTQTLVWTPAAMQERQHHDLNLPKGCMPLPALRGLGTLTRLVRLVLQGLPHLNDSAVAAYVLTHLAPLRALEHLELTSAGSAVGKGLPVPHLRQLVASPCRDAHPFLAWVRLEPCGEASPREWQDLASETHPLIRVIWADAHLHPRSAVREAHTAFELFHTPLYQQFSA